MYIETLYKQFEKILLRNVHYLHNAKLFRLRKKNKNNKNDCFLLQ